MFHPVIPSNIRMHNHSYTGADDIPEALYERIRAGFALLRSDNPLVSVNIIAWNEESNILRNLSSLSAMQSAYPVEFIIVDNNSSDRTSEIIRKCGLTPVSEKQQGYGFARQAALEASRGKYVVTGDSDTVYPPTWVDAMVGPLERGKGFATYGTYSYLPPAGKSRLGYALYELARNVVHALRTVRRPELAVGGVNFCFPREAALEIGFIRSDARMEDGKMAFALSKRGRLLRITGLRAIAWTATRSVDGEGSLVATFLSRIPKQLKWMKLYFTRKK